MIFLLINISLIVFLVLLGVSLVIILGLVAGVIVVGKDKNKEPMCIKKLRKE